ncbi:hypothetical protein CWE13_07075 [Aliidiomarina shirensis]|uniref:DUF418 domain-containing protein n=1 Tax=Aliidiomarina shirensis TaxID=1048642 RepID=A0A432WVB1_9GAMM|nr:DUF418 domain-containing protein [Aliidiomarina shirensis]RUO37702.1 hypothetical protein CWE13_07075 [Aliidiomarina shirensis]
MSTATPIAPQERIHLLDIIRGFALLGILLMNIEYFQRPLAEMMHGFNTEQVGLDYATAWGVYTFVQGKFYTMFSLLFGMGFVLFLDRAMEKTNSPRFLFFRRIFVLALFGLVHIVYIWGGDILLNYAIVGVFLLLFVKTSPRHLWKLGAAFIIIPVLLFCLGAWGIQMGLNSAAGPEMLADFEQSRIEMQQMIAMGHEVYIGGTYAEVVQYRLSEIALLYGGGGIIFFIPTILGTMLIGAAFARAGIFTNPREHRKAIRNMVMFGGLFGLPSALIIGIYGLDIEMMIPDYQGALIFLLQAIANIGLCFAYMGIIALLFLGGKKWLQHLAPAGRMALTNYLTHSIVFTTLFYGYGFGLYGEFGRFATTVMAIALYAGQLWFSTWWLQRYQYGPMEWLWRSATYMKLQPMRKA